MENITQLLQELAAKLGTTTEYLWGILIKQAHIAAYINMAVIILTILMIIATIITILYLNKKDVLDDDLRFTIYISMIAVSIIFITESACCFTSMINGFFNPEYWALQQVLDVVN